MTDAEARAILTTYGAPVNIAKHIEAINTAIRALGGKATIDALGEQPYGDDDYDLGCRNQWEWDVKAIEQLPSAQPEQHYEEWCDSCKEYDQEKHSCPRWNKVIKSTVEELKSAQPEPKTGKWLPDNNNYIYEQYVCSECKNSFKVDTCMGKPMWNFCPNCGAKMER